MDDKEDKRGECSTKPQRDTLTGKMTSVGERMVMRADGKGDGPCHACSAQQDEQHLQKQRHDASGAGGHWAMAASAFRSNAAAMSARV